MSFRRISLVTFGIWLLWVYVLITLFFGEYILGIAIRFRHLGLVAFSSLGAIYLLVWWFYGHGFISLARLQKVSLVCVVALVSILAIDFGYHGYLKVFATDGERREYSDQEIAAMGFPCRDPEDISHRAFFPSELNFLVLEPNWAAGGMACGIWSTPALMASRTLAGSIMEVRQQWYSSDEYGFRETTPLEMARVFTLGDSMTFGSATHQDNIWPEVLQTKADIPVYNLGIPGTSPRQQFLMLSCLLQIYGDSFQIEHMLWMFTEGNDLGDTTENIRTSRPTTEKDINFEKQFINLYPDCELRLPNTTARQDSSAQADTSPDLPECIPFPDQPSPASDVASTFAATSKPRKVFDKVFNLVFKIKSVSVIDGFQRGRLRLVDDPAKQFDGIKLEVPLRHSERFGYRFFITWPETAAESYVMNHPNCSALEQTFRAMGALSIEYDFEITLMVAPTAERLHGHNFDGLPRRSDSPFLIGYVEDLARKSGFSTLPLYQLMQPFADDELLYWRDDPHWNNRGHEVVAGLIAKKVFSDGEDLVDRR